MSDPINNTVVFVTIAFFVVMTYGGVKDLCPDGEMWQQTGDTGIYKCPGQEGYNYCEKLSSSNRTCYLADIKHSIEKIYKCNTEYYNDTIKIYFNTSIEEDVWGVCEREFTINNTNTTEPCIIGTVNKTIEQYKFGLVTKNNTECLYNGFKIGNNVFDFDKSGYYCTYFVDTINDKIEVECDERVGDGNGNGKCDSGEDSCEKIIIDNSKIEKKYNSKHGFDIKRDREIQRPLKIYDKITDDTSDIVEKLPITDIPTKVTL